MSELMIILKVGAGGNLLDDSICQGETWVSAEERFTEPPSAEVIFR